MRPRELLERARRLAAEREAMEAIEAGEPADLADVPIHLRREWLMRNMVICHVNPAGETVKSVTLAEHFAARAAAPDAP